MMTAVYRGRRYWRLRSTKGVGQPPTWSPLPHPQEEIRTAGSAKPGRGGRRKRKADRAKIRSRIGAGVERKGWPLTWAMRRLIAWPTFRVRALTIAQIAALSSNPIVLPPGLDLQYLEPKRRPGRRDRRRRAKLRRRRAQRRVEERAKLFALPGWGDWATLAKNWAFRRVSVEHATGKDLDRLAEIFGVKRTPGA